MDDIKNVEAVHDDDLPTLLKSLELEDDLQAGKLNCHFCKTTITMDNLYAILPINNKIVLVCDGKECVNAIMEYGTNPNKSTT